MMREYRLRKKASKLVAEKSRGLPIERPVPTFERDEIFEDTVIGKGAFCVVTEVQFMKLKGEHVHSSHSLQGTDNLQIRSLVPDSYKTDENPKYALKRVKNKLIKEKDGTFVAGVVDLVMEARLLSCLQHKNIVKIHGTSSSHPCSDSYYIILEKLYDTLTDRMKEWKRNRRLGSFINLESTTVKGEDFLAKRLMVARDISNAISYLHSHCIIYRDLKPDNVGFDINDNVKLFDFGLAKVLHHSRRIDKSDMFLLTSNTGSPRYMAPEVALKKPYNFKADIYSLGILIWSIRVLKTPYPNHSILSLQEKVYAGKERPELDRNFSEVLQDILSLSWHQDPYERPCGSILTMTLEQEIKLLLGNIVNSNRDETSHITRSQ